KFVLTELGADIPSDFPPLLSTALTALGLHPKSKTADGDLAEATKRILGGLQQIGLGINDLRNGYATGHAKVKAAKLSVRHARLAANAAVPLATAMVETLEARGAPWRGQRSTTGLVG